MALSQYRISELTGYNDSELSYNSASTMKTYPFVSNVCDYLRKLGYYNGANTTQYNDKVSDAVAEFQASLGKSPTGTLNDSTLQMLIKQADEYASDEIGGGNDDGDASDNSTGQLYGAHYDAFFSGQNYKLFRQNGKDIKIILGDGSVIKTIKNVYMRSVSTEVDTSGNPISETYEFIARDILESDEINDTGKYLESSLGDKAPSDVKYDFSGYIK